MKCVIAVVCHLCTVHTKTTTKIIVKETSQFKTVYKDDSGCITQLKQQKIQKVTLRGIKKTHMECPMPQFIYSYNFPAAAVMITALYR